MVFIRAAKEQICLILLSCFSCGIETSTCNFNVKVKQALLNEGFHRNLTYGVVFNSDNELESWLYKDCILGLDQTLPAGVYANPDELSDLSRNRKVNAVPKQRINTELPAEMSSPSGVYLLGNVLDSKVYLWLPVHARYHQAVSGGGSARNKISDPKLYLLCPDQRLDLCEMAVAPALSFLCNGSSGGCGWKEVPYTMMTKKVVWEVPVGDTDHYYLVAVITALMVITGSLYLLQALHEHALAARRKAC